MKKKELFEEIFNCSERLKKEYAEYLAFCAEKTGKDYRKMVTSKNRALGLVLYALKRNMVINRTTVSTMLRLAEKGELPPPQEVK